MTIYIIDTVEGARCLFPGICHGRAAPGAGTLPQGAASRDAGSAASGVA